MLFGNRRQPFPRGGWVALAVVALTGLVSACGAGNPFDRSLERLDRELGFSTSLSASTSVLDRSDAERLLDSAKRRAKSLSDWSRLMNRAFWISERIGDPSIAARAADAARKAYPTYEDIALCACRAYIDAGRAKDALALFPTPLDPKDRGTWFAEAFLAAYGESGRDTSGAGDIDVLRLLAEASGSGEPAIDAALLRMGAGDSMGAASFLRYAARLGAPVDPGLAWDAGVLDVILSDPGDVADGEGDLRKAEAALLLGERDWAREYLTGLVLSRPDYDWKAYRMLASLETDASREEFWYDTMAERFPANPSAVRAYAAHLARTGKKVQAIKELETIYGESPEDPRTAVLMAEIRSLIKPDEPAFAQALRISNEFPEDPYVQAWALGRLAASERYVDAAKLYRQLQSRGMDLGQPWYFEALLRILDGRLDEAVEIVERDGPAEGGPEAAFALGVLYARTGKYDVSVDRFRVAVSASESPEDKARALVEMGKSYAAEGDGKAAREVWSAALSLCPDSAEALRLYTTQQ